jgi:hypothetical protein
MCVCVCVDYTSPTLCHQANGAYRVTLAGLETAAQLSFGVGQIALEFEDRSIL